MNKITEREKITEDIYYKTALKFAEEKHSGQKRIGGEPYIVHPIAVSNMLLEEGFGKEYISAALLHDVLEDTDAKPEEIRENWGKAVADAVLLLTKKKGYITEKYLADIEKNDIAKHVKICDRINNLESAANTGNDFKNKYINETEKYYLSLDKNTVFDGKISEALEKLKKETVIYENK